MAFSKTKFFSSVVCDSLYIRNFYSGFRNFFGKKIGIFFRNFSEIFHISNLPRFTSSSQPGLHFRDKQEIDPGTSESTSALATLASELVVSSATKLYTVLQKNELHSENIKTLNCKELFITL